MTATTGSPGFIEYYTNSDLDPIPDGFASLATSVNAALGGLITDERQLRSYRWATATQRNAQVGMQPGDTGYQVDIGARFTYHGSGGWTQDPMFLGDMHSTDQVATPGNTTIVAVGPSAVNFTLSGTSNVRVVSTLLVNANTAPARGRVYACVVQGLTPTMTGALVSSVYSQVAFNAAGSAGRASGTVEQTFRLNAGQWTVFPGLQSDTSAVMTALDRNYCSAYIV